MLFIIDDTILAVVLLGRSTVGSGVASGRGVAPVLVEAVEEDVEHGDLLEGGGGGGRGRREAAPRPPAGGGRVFPGGREKGARVFLLCLDVV